MTDLHHYDWLEPLTLAIPVDYQKQGDEWLEYLQARIAETSKSHQLEIRSAIPFGHLYTPGGGALESSLLVGQSTDNRPICSVAGKGEKRPQDVALWSDAVTHAVTQLGNDTTFPWTAIIGEDPDYSTSPSIKLASPCIIGEIELESSEDLFFELRPGGGLSSATSNATYPVYARGLNSGYAWNISSQNAVTDLKFACSLLSLASDRIWRLRQSPQTYPKSLYDQHGKNIIQIPKYSPFYPEPLKKEDNFGDPTLFELPAWVNDAWTKIKGDRALAQLVATYHESLLLGSKNHDSFELLALVAIVESIGNRHSEKLPRCPCRKAIRGSTERFRTTLRKVMDNDTAANLARLVYGHRSDTAHNGTLLGTELITGALTGINFMVSGTPFQFKSTVRELRSITVSLLRSELTSEVSLE